jgi:glyoxylase-like metal-dependent hydrolase (beta-lactamase superfamily II)
MWLDVYSDNSYETNCWLIGADGSDDAVVVDPGFSAGTVHRMLETSGRRPVAVLATHGHVDHVGAAADFCGDELPLHIHEADALALTDPQAWGGGSSSRAIAVKQVKTLADGDVLTFAGFRIEVIHTPGHTPGSVCFRTDGWVLTGDLVFAGTIGRHDFPNSNAAQMESSLRRFLTLPDPLDVYPGHGPKTTVGRERRQNPYLLDL